MLCGVYAAGEGESSLAEDGEGGEEQTPHQTHVPAGQSQRKSHEKVSYQTSIFYWLTVKYFLIFRLLPDIGSLGLTTTEDGRDTCDISSHQKEPSSRLKDLSSSAGSSKSRKTRTSSKFQESQTLSTHKEVESTEPLERHESAVVPDAEKDGATPLTMTTLLETGSVKVCDYSCVFCLYPTATSLSS